MALVGVLLGISMAVLGWLLREQHYDRKLIIQLQNDLYFTQSRVNELEKRRAIITEAVAAAPKPANVRRQWSEDVPAKEARA